MPRISVTTKEIGLLHQLYKEGQIQLAPEFQRNSVWPRAAKAYLMDSILVDKPIPLLFFQRVHSAQSGRSVYSVIDGQQRLRAIFDFLEDRVRLNESDSKAPFYRKKFSELPPSLQTKVLNYDLPIHELSDFTEQDIRDMFVRMNKYVVKLSPQEIRHSRESGKFRDFVEDLGKLSFWTQHSVFTPLQISRFRAVEFAAELTILLVEGPQDKKQAIDLYYGRYKDSLPFGRQVKTLIESYLNWIIAAIPTLASSRFRKPVDLYSFIGALDVVSNNSRRLHQMRPEAASGPLAAFEKETAKKEVSGAASRYVVAASRQTDNLRPRMTRIELISNVLREV